MLKPKELPALETGKQCRAAIKEIRKKTDWTLARLADYIDVNYETLRKVEKGYTKNPGEWLRGEIAQALVQVRAMP